MILENISELDIRFHEVKNSQIKRVDYLVYSCMGQPNHMDFTRDEDVLMIYSNRVKKRIYLSEKFNTISVNDYLNEYGIRENIKVLGYNQSEFESKYFVVLL